MAILFGTQSNGETLPVLVDQFGNLLAKGIDGAPGQEGPPGGSFPLPPDPYEGALLGWLNNELAWIGTPSKAPIPEGLFGPITSWDTAGRLVVEGEIPSEIAQGVYVYQCNQDGSIFVDGWNNSQAWSNDLGSTSSFERAKELAFDGSESTFFMTTGRAGTTVTFSPEALSITNSIEIYLPYDALADDASVSYRYALDGAIYDVVGGTNSNGWITLQGFAGKTISTSTPLVISVLKGDPQLWLSGIKVDGKILVDKGDYPIAPNLNFRVQSVNGQNLIGSPNRTDDFSIGKYLRVPQQNVARWLYDGNLNKVITSTGIDISRLTGI